MHQGKISSNHEPGGHVEPGWPYVKQQVKFYVVEGGRYALMVIAVAIALAMVVGVIVTLVLTVLAAVHAR